MDDSIRQIQKLLDTAEGNLHSARNLLRKYIGDNKPAIDAKKVLENLNPPEETVIEGIFNGSEMIGNDSKTYQIPPNYASKSKLVEGDVLKLTIAADGSYVFKQIQPVERQSVTGTLVLGEGGAFTVNADGKNFKVLTASVTFYKAEVGDTVTAIVPKEHDASWAVIDNVIPQNTPNVETVAVESPIPEQITTVAATPLENTQTPEAISSPAIDVATLAVTDPTTQNQSEVIATPEVVPAAEPTTEQTQVETVIPAVVQKEALPNNPEVVIQPPNSDTDMKPVATDNSSSIQIQYPGGQPTNDEELLAKLKENLANIKKPDIENVTPGTAVDTADATVLADNQNIQPTTPPVVENTVTPPPVQSQPNSTDQPIAELNI